MWVPLSVMMEFGTPNLWTMSVKNDTAHSALRLVIGHASTHFENLSIVTNRCVKPLSTFCRGPMMSIPHMVNEHVMGMV
jgi:hypothetical protein